MFQTLCSRLHPATAVGTSGLLGMAILLGGSTFVEAGVRDLFTKSTSQKQTTRTAASQPSARTAPATKLSKKPGQPLLAQADAPLERLRQRNAEQRLREAVDENELFPFDEVNDDARSGESIPTPTAKSPNPKKLELPASARTAEPAPIQPPDDRIAILEDEKPGDEALPEPVTSPANLKKITEIQPYFDYQPKTSLKGEVCWDLCPRPDGMPCKPDENGNMPECPSEFKLSEENYSHRPMSDCLYQWKAADLWHNPLYFEDVGLERYGHVHREYLQPFVSVGRFGVQLVGLPYQMSIDPVCKKMYTLGYYRPGECAPKKHYRIPWNTKAAVTEAGVWTGLGFIFP